MCKICNNNYEGLKSLTISKCPYIKIIPNIDGLEALNIDGIQQTINIPIIKGLRKLQLLGCNNIKEIPNIESLYELCIVCCNNITNIINIPILKKIKNLTIINSNIFNISIIENIENIEIINNINILDMRIYYNYFTHDNNEYTIKHLYSIIKIVKWYKKLKLSKKLWMYADLVIRDSMNPHKENNIYLEQYIENKVYKD